MSIVDTLSSSLSCSAAHIITSHNPIQLAAISNYKLAQLTFAPPDLHSLRKTAIIKNVIEDIYSNTPSDWLQQMTRWQFLTPESLEDMTQEGLEEIFAQYCQAIEAFRPVRPISAISNEVNDLFLDEVDDSQTGDDLWIAEDDTTNHTQKQQQEPLDEKSISKACATETTTAALFSQPNTTISNDLVTVNRIASPLSDKPLPAHPVNYDVYKTNTTSAAIAAATKARRRSSFGGSKNRLSWTSDTGITSSAVSQNLANELMSLFDMDFAIDINLDTAPKLPELPFKPKNDNRKSYHRQSQDMLTSLMPAFEKIALETTIEFNNYKSLQSTPNTNRAITSVPQRSSSLRFRQQEEYGSSVSLTAVPDQPSAAINKSKSKKKAILRLASSLIGGKKSSSTSASKSQSKDKLPYSYDLSPESLKDYSSSTSSIAQVNASINNTPRKASTSTVETSASSSPSSSSWSYISADHVEMKAVIKPLPEPLAAATKATAQVHNNKYGSKRKRSTKKKRRSALIGKTVTKRKSGSHKLASQSNAAANGLPATPSTSSSSLFEPLDKGLSRSKSAFLRIGNGLKSKKSQHQKQIKRAASAKHLNETMSADSVSSDVLQSSSADLYKHDSQDNGLVSKNASVPILSTRAFTQEQPVEQHQQHNDHQSFVKRMASFHWKMKSRDNYDGFQPTVEA